MPSLPPDAGHSTVRDELPTTRFDAIVIRVTSGPDAGAQLVVPAKIAADRVVVGTSPTSDLRLQDPRISRRHLAIAIAPAGIHIIDLESSNGTFVRGLRIAESWLEPGEPITIGETTLVIDRATESSASDAREAERADRFGRMVGVSYEMQRLFALGIHLAASDIPVLIEGETGTGKELFAEELHAQGPRRDGPFVVIDAFADDPQRGAALIFGAGPGVFASLPEGRPGLLEAAQGGTLLIDQPGELAPELQRRLARALARREVQRVGSEAAVPFDARVVSTSAGDLDCLVERGLLREDLFYSIAGARVELPPLRRRLEDVPLLVRHFWSAAGGPHDPPAPLITRFAAQAWPGNVRELELAVARHLAVGSASSGSGSLRRDPISPPAPLSSEDLVGQVLARRLPLARARQEVIVSFERLYVEQILREHGGNVTRAAQASGLAHRYFQALKARRGF